MNQSAQGLASLGRNGDSMLVHMSPEEVGGLKQVGNSLGIKMSTNPYTGMPEAFSFGDFFTSFLPTIVGAAVGGPAGGGLMSSMTPILAGAGTGALLAAAKGDDPLMGGITGGFGGYGGSQLGQSFSGAFGKGTTASSMGDLVNKGVTNLNPAIGQSGIVGSTGQLGPDMSFGVAGKQAADLTTQTLPNFAAGPNFTPTAPVAPTVQMAQNVGDLASGVKNLTGFGDMSIGDAYGKFTQAGGTAADLAMPVGGAVLAGLEPSDLGYGTGNLYEDPDKGKYRGPQGQLNLSDKYSSGLRLVAKGGYIDGYAEGGTIATGGIRDLYGSSDNQNQAPLSRDGYGLGRLNQLGNQQSLSQAQTLGYADGGGVGGEAVAADESVPNPEGVVSKYTTVVDDKGVASRMRVPYQYEKIIIPGVPDFNTIPPIKYNPYTYAGAVRKQPGMARGGYLDGQGDGMSDSIPATIEGKQPARLADGEFVVPADVVSHLGNGSSKAGSKRLYAMLDKVRHARTGNKKQGKEINPAKYMPA